jgi:hypothetical protein
LESCVFELNLKFEDEVHLLGHSINVDLDVDNLVVRALEVIYIVEK